MPHLEGISTLPVTKFHAVSARLSRTIHAVGVRDQHSRNEQVVFEDRPHHSEHTETTPRAPSKLEEHVYRDDGLVEVNPKGQHPIFELMQRAEDEWETKLRRASTTLEQAVREYRRRYRRSPPPGFDKWWDYVEKHNVQLPDEYDQIYHDLEPFWGIDPVVLQQVQQDWEAHADSFTLGKDSLEDPLDIKNYSLPGQDIASAHLGPTKGAYEIIDLLRDVEDSIPAFRAVFSPHDNPNLSTDYELKEMALRAAAAGTFIDVENPPEVKLSGWVSACSPDSPARRERIHFGSSPKPKRTKTFIHSHHQSMDPCLHPSHLLLHGQFISHRKGPVPHRKLIPQFSYCPTMLHHDITPAMPINWLEDLPRDEDPEWENKMDGRLQWRGSNTGIWHAEDQRWDLAQRARLIKWAGGTSDSFNSGGSSNSRQRYRGRSHSTNSENVTVLLPAVEGQQIGTGMEVKRALWLPAMADIAFAGPPLNCPPDVCKKLDDIFEFRKRQDGPVAGRYKYVIDVDGNGWSSRFKRLITSNALVFKSTVYPEWYTERVQPWLHYVPIQVDLSDLWDALVFFRGDPTGEHGHDDLAKKIAVEGRKWSKTFWRKEDLTAYMFRLFLEYARVMDPERTSMSYDSQGEDFGDD